MSITEKDKKINESKDNEKDSRIAITFPSSSIKISGVSIILSESSKFDIGISNTNVGNGDINYKKVPKVKYDINWRSERVFYH